eukprot:TRINITY_DN9941_c0_g1_i3.p1 TRINITY_DN9941_c0_g1~~TRINITY_DN9941_c0_g1_i3.p1  ORF type:complete len:182 (+),score=9.57 TRINITY_DN9941_c0_g1_i3:90-635(+)
MCIRDRHNTSRSGLSEFTTASNPGVVPMDFQSTCSSFASRASGRFSLHSSISHGCTQRSLSSGCSNSTRSSRLGTTGKLSEISLMRDCLWDNGTPLNVARKGARWPIDPFEASRKLRKQPYGKAIGFPYEGAFAGRFLYEPAFPGIPKEATGLNYRFEVEPSLVRLEYPDSDQNQNQPKRR